MVTLVKGDFIIDQDFFIERSEKILTHLKLDGDITIKLSNKDESRALNLQYRKKDYATDVLSFPINENFPDSFYIGDILICYPVAEEQAESGKISLKNELSALICHGILHLAGYDHEEDSGEMFILQDELIGRYFQ